MAPTVHLVDDDPAVRKAVSRLLRGAGFRVATFGRAADLLAVCSPESRGCVLLDLAMPIVDGIETQRRLADAGCTMPVLFLTGRGDISSSVLAMKRGALDFLCKPIERTVLLDAVRGALDRDAEGAENVVPLAAFRVALATLTPREREVFAELLTGKLNKQIAADIGIVEKTVKVHRARVLSKLGVRSIAELVRLSERAGIFG